MRKRLMIITGLFVMFAGCSPLNNLKEPLAYKSIDFIDLTGVYALEAVFYPDHTFEYIIQGQKYDIFGDWEQRQDTVILYSDKFYEKSLWGGYMNKYTQAEAGKDIYLIRRNSLYEINPKRIKLLVKTSKEHMDRIKSR